MSLVRWRVFHGPETQRPSADMCSGICTATPVKQLSHTGPLGPGQSQLRSTASHEGMVQLCPQGLISYILCEGQIR